MVEVELAEEEVVDEAFGELECDPFIMGPWLAAGGGVDAAAYGVTTEPPPQGAGVTPWPQMLRGRLAGRWRWWAAFCRSSLVLEWIRDGYKWRWRGDVAGAK